MRFRRPMSVGQSAQLRMLQGKIVGAFTCPVCGGMRSGVKVEGRTLRVCTCRSCVICGRPIGQGTTETCGSDLCFTQLLRARGIEE